jgi:hypothetical protein
VCKYVNYETLELDYVYFAVEQRRLYGELEEIGKNVVLVSAKVLS